jgi:LmbE family N-acetylglucosaminyl deacetylase
VQWLGRLRVALFTTANLRRAENREAFSAVDIRAICWLGFASLAIHSSEIRND